MKQWVQAWHNIAKRLPLAGLEALAEAVANNDTKLVSGRFVTSDECGCAIGFATLHGRRWNNWIDAEEDASAILMNACETSAVGQPSPTAFTQKFDDELDAGPAHRERFFAEFRPEVDRAIIDHKAKDIVRLSDAWWESPNPAFQYATPMDELRRHGRERLEQMLYHMESGVAS